MLWTTIQKFCIFASFLHQNRLAKMMVTHIGDALMTVCSALFVSYQHFCGWPRLLAPSVRRFGCNGAGNLAITTRPGESNPRSGEDQATLEEQVQRKEQTFDTERLVARTITHHT
jgi:hypothetical protein